MLKKNLSMRRIAFLLVCIVLSIYVLFQTKDDIKRLVDFTSGAITAPQRSLALRRDALNSMEMGDWDEAEMFYLAAVAADPTSFHAIIDLADIYLLKPEAEPEKALELYWKAHEILPNDCRVFIGIVRALIDQNRNEEILAIHQEALECVGDSTILEIHDKYTLLGVFGRTFYMMREYESAKGTLENVREYTITLDPEMMFPKTINTYFLVKSMEALGESGPETCALWIEIYEEGDNMPPSISSEVATRVFECRK